MIHIYQDPDALALGVATAIARAAGAAISARGGFRIALSGGSTPRRLYQRLASAEWLTMIDWRRVDVFFADERAVPPDHVDSNYRMVRESLLGTVGVPTDQVHRMRGEAEDLDTAAREYEPLLEAPLDLALLGMGEDGHTASLFPGSHALAERERRVIAVTGPKAPARRLTVTPRVLDEAREIVMMVSGVEKAAVVANVLEAKDSVLPGRLLRGRDWYVDAAAASELVRGAEAQGEARDPGLSES